MWISRKENRYARLSAARKGERALPCLEETGEGKNNAAIYPLFYVGEPGRERNAGLDKNGIGLPGGKEVFASIPGNARALGVFGEFFRVWI